MPSKNVSSDKRLQALAIYTMATQHYTKTREYERALADLLRSDEEFISEASDAIYGSDPCGSFDDWFKAAGYTVKKPKSRKRK